MFGELTKIIDGRNLLLLTQVVARANKSGDANAFLKKHLQWILDIEDGVKAPPQDIQAPPVQGPRATVVENRGHQIPKGRSR